MTEPAKKHEQSSREKILPLELRGIDNKPVEITRAIEKPTVFILPGIRVNREMTRDIQAEYIKGMIGAVVGSINRAGIPRPQTYCAIYSHKDETPYLREHFPLAKLPPELCAPNQDARDFVRKVLFPAIGLSVGARPPVDEVCRRLSRITLFSHSSGTVFAKEVNRAFRDELAAFDCYSARDVARMCHEVVSIAIAHGGAVRRERGDTRDEPAFRTISFGAQADLTVLISMERMAERYKHLNGGAKADARSFYHAAGYDHDLATARQINPLNMPRNFNALHAKPVHGGVLVTADLPGELTWNNGKRDYVVNRDEMHKTFEKLCFGMALHPGGHDTQRRPIGINGEPLAVDDIVPEHHVPMFMVPTECGNRAMVEKVDEALRFALARAPLRQPNWATRLTAPKPHAALAQTMGSSVGPANAR